MITIADLAYSFYKERVREGRCGCSKMDWKRAELFYNRLSKYLKKRGIVNDHEHKK